MPDLHGLPLPLGAHSCAWRCRVTNALSIVTDVLKEATMNRPGSELRRRLGSRRGRTVLVSALLMALTTTMVLHLQHRASTSVDVLRQEPLAEGPFVPSVPEVPSALPATPSSSPSASPSAVATATKAAPILREIDDSSLLAEPACETDMNHESCPDGQPGWYAGFTSCQPSRGVSADEGDAPLPGMTLTFALPSESVTAGNEVEGELHITNGSDSAVELTIAPTTATADQFIADVYGPGGGGGVYGSDVIANQRITLAPGEVLTRAVQVPTSSCGDTRTDPAPPLSPGKYAASVTVSFSDPVVLPDPEPSSSASSSASPSPSASPSATPNSVREYGSWSAATSFTIID